MKFLQFVFMTMIITSSAAQSELQIIEPDRLSHFWESPSGEILEEHDIYYFDINGTWTFFRINTDDERINIFQREIDCTNIELRGVDLEIAVVYPNPTSDRLTIHQPNNSGFIELLTIDGQRLMKKEITNHEIIFNVNSMPTGNCILIISGDIRSSTHKVNIIN